MIKKIYYLLLSPLMILSGCYHGSQEPVSTEESIAWVDASTSLSLADIQAELTEVQSGLLALKELVNHQIVLSRVAAPIMSPPPSKTPVPPEEMGLLKRLIAGLENKVDQQEKLYCRTSKELNKLSDAVKLNHVAVQGLEATVSQQRHELNELSLLPLAFETLSSMAHEYLQNMQETKRLDLPSKPHRVHKVRAGDTLKRISVLYSIDIQTLRIVNQINGDRLFVGQEIVVPDSKQEGAFSSYINRFSD